MLCLLILFKLWLCCWFFEIKRTGQTVRTRVRKRERVQIIFSSCSFITQSALSWAKTCEPSAQKLMTELRNHISDIPKIVSESNGKQEGKKKAWHTLPCWVSSNFAHNGQQINDMRGHVDTQTESIYMAEEVEQRLRLYWPAGVLQNGSSAIIWPANGFITSSSLPPKKRRRRRRRR